MNLTSEDMGGRLLGIGALKALLQMGTGHDKVAAIERENSHKRMGLSHQDRVVLALRQVEELLT
jgi:hypothetical protein